MRALRPSARLLSGGDCGCITVHAVSERLLCIVRNVERSSTRTPVTVMRVELGARRGQPRLRFRLGMLRHPRPATVALPERGQVNDCWCQSLEASLRPLCWPLRSHITQRALVQRLPSRHPRRRLCCGIRTTRLRILTLLQHRTSRRACMLPTAGGRRQRLWRKLSTVGWVERLDLPRGSRQQSGRRPLQHGPNRAVYQFHPSTLPVRGSTSVSIGLRNDTAPSRYQ